MTLPWSETVRSGAEANQWLSKNITVQLGPYVQLHAAYCTRLVIVLEFF